MKIAYFHQYFKTPQEPGATRSYWIAQELISRGHKVVMISGNQAIKKSREIKTIDGIKVIYLKVLYNNRMGIFQRFWSFVSFMFRSTIIAFKQKNIDLVIATSTPLTIGVPALMLNIFKKKPYLFEVRDLWPEVPIQMGGLKNSILKIVAKELEIQVYKRAKHIVTLSPGMYEGVIKRGINQEKVSMIPNMAKVDKFWPREVNSSIIKKYNLNRASFKVIHFGAMGLSNGLEYIINAANEISIKKIYNVDFIFLGDGMVKEKLIAEAKLMKLSNVYFLGELPMSETSEIVNACDISVVTFANLPILATNSPNKLFDSLSAGKPIVVNSNGWTKEMVEKYNCGFYVDASRPEDFAKLLIEISDNKQLLIKLGHNARQLAEKRYDKSILCKEFNDLVESKFSS